MPCINRLNAINTHGRYGAVNTSSPRNDSRVSGFRRDQIYTSVLESALPRNGMLVVNTVLSTSNELVAYSSSQLKTALLGPEACSSRRE